MQTLYLLTFGGGTNSTALLIELVKRKHQLDFIIFSDTGAETENTYRHIKRMSSWLIQNGYPEIIFVQTTNREGQKITLEEDCLKYKRLPSLAYGFKGCSLKFKKRPQDKYMNNNPVAKEIWKQGGKITKIIGFDADEEHRAKRFVEDKKYVAWYPLIDWDIGRKECIEIIKKAGFALPGKSSCFFCPAMKKQEIKDLYTCNRHLYDRAIEIEKNANLQSVSGLGRSFSWENLIRNYDSQQKLFNIEISCDCYDG